MIQKRLTLKQQIAQNLLKGALSFSVDRIKILYQKKSIPTDQKIIVISVSKKTIPKATARNRIKRQIKGAFDLALQKSDMVKYNWMVICKTAIYSKEISFALQKKLQTLSYE